MSKEGARGDVALNTRTTPRTRPRFASTVRLVGCWAHSRQWLRRPPGTVMSYLVDALKMTSNRELRLIALRPVVPSCWIERRRQVAG